MLLLEILGGLLVLAMLVPAMISLVLYLQVRALGRDSLRLVPADPRRFGHAIADAKSHDAWFESQGFRLAACCVLSAMQKALITVWQHEERPTYVCIYHVQNQRVYDFVTLFSDDIGLTTGSSADAHMLPLARGSYTQSFPGTGLDRLWTRHVESEEYLLQQGAVALPQIEQPFEEVFLRAVRRQMAHVRSLPFWPLRGTYWYFVRRHRMKNHTVAEQHEAGWIKLPREIRAETA